MLINSFEHNVDAKGRVFIPSKWREDLGDTVIATRGMTVGGESRCLFVMPMKVWNEILERFNRIPMSDVRAQNAMRQIFASACECELDKQGRILISDALWKYAEVVKDAVLIGMGNRAEIWSGENWQRYCEAQEHTDGEIGLEMLNYLSELGI